jgi:glycyl-tRNA synthetase beta chain
MNKNFLLEIGTEELPPKQIDGLVAALATNLIQGLKKTGLPFGSVNTFSTPRRLAVLIEGITSQQPKQLTEFRGPSIAIALDKSGSPTIAATNFGVDISKLKRMEDKKGIFLMHQTVIPGKKTDELLPEIIINSIKKLPLKKSMNWGENTGPFVRPIHWITAIFGYETIKIEIFGIQSSNKTYGHRFHHPKTITIIESKQYEKLLVNKGWVIANAQKRKQSIRDQIIALTHNEKTIIPEDLLLEVTNLVEWPIALVGTFNARFLKIPREVLITTLKNQQRCFPIVDEAGELLPRFVMISNIASKVPKQVITGNEKVINARFTDAEYFYYNDLKLKFANNLPKLKSVSFQEKLGSLYDKTLRLKTLAAFIATKIGADITHTRRAAELSKCDLITSMVWEFPELQGIMGYYYTAKHENESIAIAIKEQYLPHFSKDTLPTTSIGCALALADRIDNLIGLFGINKIPTGDKDPFGLRRAATGVLRIILEKNLDLDLKHVLENSCLTYQGIIKNKDEVVTKVLNFVYERLHSWYVEQNRDTNTFRAVLACTPTNLQDFTKRFAAVERFIQLPEINNLIDNYKRIRNILDKAQYSDKSKFNLNLATEVAERNLADLVLKTERIIHEYYQNTSYFELLLELVKLTPSLNSFFDKVMVMTDDTKVRQNRLALLKLLKNLFVLVVDLSYLISGDKAPTHK